MRADALLWWTKGQHLPPLVTASPAGTSQADAGVIGVPGTTVLFGDSTVNGGGRAGIDSTIGMWIDCCHLWGIEGNYFDLGDQSTNYNSGLSNGNPIIARPFVDVTDPTNPFNNSELVAYPGVLSGMVTVHAADGFQSAGIRLRRNLLCCCQDCCGNECDECGKSCGDCGKSCSDCCSCNTCCERYFRLDFTAGYRYYNYSDNVDVQENLITGVSAVQAGTQIQRAGQLPCPRLLQRRRVGLDRQCGARPLVVAVVGPDGPGRE